ncbi:hypothetical protein LSAT2_012292 [Lamellibrachia satsuma]|nr:hypothetical protein LSAT2_012292 [Lamellibrachia satsuma]
MSPFRIVAVLTECDVGGVSLVVRLEPEYMAAGLSTRPALLPLLMATLLVQLTTGADVLPPPDCALSAGNEGYGATCSRMSDIPERLHGHLRKLKLVNTTLTVLENGSLSHLPRLAVLDLSGKQNRPFGARSFPRTARSETTQPRTQ